MTKNFESFENAVNNTAPTSTPQPQSSEESPQIFDYSDEPKVGLANERDSKTATIYKTLDYLSLLIPNLIFIKINSGSYQDGVDNSKYSKCSPQPYGGHKNIEKILSMKSYSLDKDHQIVYPEDHPEYGENNPKNKKKIYYTQNILTQDVEFVYNWWKADYNFGIITGERTGIVVIDLDDQKRYDDFCAETKFDKNSTLIVKTPRGYHIYYKCGADKGYKPTSAEMDFRTNGNHVVGPGSHRTIEAIVDGVKTQNTKIYEIINFDVKEIPVMPGSVAEFVERYNGESFRKPNNTNVKSDLQKIKNRKSDYDNKVPKMMIHSESFVQYINNNFSFILEGTRNSTLCHLSGILSTNYNLSFSEKRNVMEFIYCNNLENSDSFLEQDLDNIIKMPTFDPKPPYIDGYSDARLLQLIKDTNNFDKTIIVKDKLQSSQSGEFYGWNGDYYEHGAEYIFENPKTFCRKELDKLDMEIEDEAVAISESVQDKINGYYVANQKELKNAETEYMTQLKSSRQLYFNALARLESFVFMTGCRKELLSCANKDFVFSFEQLDKQPNLLPTTNGMTNLKNGRTYPHCPLYLNSYVITVAKNKNGTELQNWIKTVREIFGDDNYDFMQRWCGYCLSGETGEKRFLVIKGETNSGKSLFLTTIKNAFGKIAGTMPAESFKKDHIDNFRLAPLVGKRLVVIDDFPQFNLDIDLLKILVSQSPVVSIEPKYQNKRDFSPCAKFMFTTNNTVQTPQAECSEAFENRLTLVEVKNYFPIDTKFFEAYTQSKEIQSEVIRWCVQGAVKYYHDGLQIPYKILKASQDAVRSQDSVRNFYLDKVRKGTDAFTSVKYIYIAYAQYCNEEKCCNGLEKSRNAFWTCFRNITGLQEKIKNNVRGYECNILGFCELNESIQPEPSKPEPSQPEQPVQPKQDLFGEIKPDNKADGMDGNYSDED